MAIFTLILTLTFLLFSFTAVLFTFYSYQGQPAKPISLNEGCNRTFIRENWIFGSEVSPPCPPLSNDYFVSKNLLYRRDVVSETSTNQTSGTSQINGSNTNNNQYSAVETRVGVGNSTSFNTVQYLGNVATEVPQESNNSPPDICCSFSTGGTRVPIPPVLVGDTERTFTDEQLNIKPYNVNFGSRTYNATCYPCSPNTSIILSYLSKTDTIITYTVQNQRDLRVEMDQSNFTPFTVYRIVDGERVIEANRSGGSLQVVIPSPSYATQQIVKISQRGVNPFQPLPLPSNISI